MKNYKVEGFVPPDGGWGYVIAFSVSVTFIITFMPMVTFGIVFGTFLQELGDEASNVALVSGIYLAVQWFTGLIANPLLQKYAYRKVGLLGAAFYSLGATLTIFVNGLDQLIASFAILQALGYGLMLPTILTAYNLYFEKRRAFIYNSLNVFIILVISTTPALASFLMSTYGFRGTLIFYAGFALNCFPVMLCLQPIKWHMKRATESVHVNSVSEVDKQELQRFEEDEKLKEKKIKEESLDVQSGCVNRFQRFAEAIDLPLLLDPVYLNTAIGVALCISADYAFLSVFPLVIDNFKIYDSDATLIMTIYYASDVFGRALVSTLTAFVNLNSKYLILLGAVLNVVLRSGFLVSHTFWWIAIISAITGSSRCLLQTMFALVFGDLYPNRFVAAFSFFMVFCGIISLGSGFLIGVIKDITQDNEFVVHFITVMYAMCAAPWILEYMYFKFIKR